jgi:hypothetical protein
MQVVAFKIGVVIVLIGHRRRHNHLGNRAITGGNAHALNVHVDRKNGHHTKDRQNTRRQNFDDELNRPGRSNIFLIFSCNLFIIKTVLDRSQLLLDDMAEHNTKQNCEDRKYDQAEKQDINI